MKLTLDEAYVSAVTNLMENHGEDLVPAKALKLTATASAFVMDQFSSALEGTLFAKDLPRIPEIGSVRLRAEYENAHFAINGLKFTRAEVSKIEFEPKAGSLVGLVLTVKVTPDEAQAGKLDALLKHTTKVVLEKMTQKPLVEDEEPDDGDGDGQGELDGVETPRRAKKR